ncbi:hypothetical protein PIB30_024974 [Stylosanthes scabra]|uniref:U-box domain-containing protein n=1 Tax=Stylosanthes scabra TaxID=79078 RepID=A0ABU6X7H0_9FABA|nr:hypothetical protein [Stylosanthes scabra]
MGVGEGDSTKPEPESNDGHRHQEEDEDDDDVEGEEEEGVSESRTGMALGLSAKVKGQRQRQQPPEWAVVQQVSEKLVSGSLQWKIEAAREIRKLVRKSPSSAKTRSRLGAAGVVQPLVFMLSSSNPDARHSSLLALLNLAVRNERNKVKIVTAGAIPPLVELLKTENSSIRELATAAILTLSAAAPNKPIIAASGAAPLLVQILNSGSNSTDLLDAGAVSPLINLLKECKKYSKFAEKATALLEILSNSEEGRTAISVADGGILTLVETVEDGSLVSTQHAVGTLLSLCLSCRDKYRELILKEGAIPGLLRLTVEGTAEAQDRARLLLDLLRDSPPERRLASSVLEKIVYDIAERVDGVDKAAETAKRLLQDMVQRSMEQSLNCIQHRAASCNPSVIPST